MSLVGFWEDLGQKGVKGILKVVIVSGQDERREPLGTYLHYHYLWNHEM